MGNAIGHPCDADRRDVRKTRRVGEHLCARLSVPGASSIAAVGLLWDAANWDAIWHVRTPIVCRSASRVALVRCLQQARGGTYRCRRRGGTGGGYIGAVARRRCAPLQIWHGVRRGRRRRGAGAINGAPNAAGKMAAPVLLGRPCREP